MDEKLKDVEAARYFLRARTNAVKVARLDLYAKVAAAWRAGARPGDIATAAGWSTKKAVYDAIAVVGKNAEGDNG